ncbi:MAG: EAL domain-containing protein [Lacrimispora sp.]|uniref:putative bifunctional diguanylate cyclase/phosphodiesterase n=1 Tax=Lacrimispora sp. TaxID=2719234 RepID=UPI0039E4A8FF
MDEREKTKKGMVRFQLPGAFLRTADCPDEIQPEKIALKITALYLIMGVLWILFSDRLLLDFVTNKELVSAISMAKGWLYVVITAIMLYFLIKSSFLKIQSINIELLNYYKEMRDFHEKLTASEQKLQKQIEMLKESEERYRLISETANDGIWDEKRGERNFSERWFEITGYTKQDLLEYESWLSLIHPEDAPKVFQKLEENRINRDPNYLCEYRLRYKDGGYRWILSKARLIFDDTGKIIRSAGSHTDISELKNYEDELMRLAYEDYLTHLPNRTAFYEKVKRELAGCPEQKKALMFIDIDNFKYINDTLGHVCGDKLISEIGKRLLDLSSSSQSVYRIGGDEFIIFIHQYETIDEITAIAESVIQSFSHSFKLPECTLTITVSLGIALYPVHGSDVDTLLKCADMAMYKAKSIAHGRYIFYTRDMDMKVQERMTLESELRTALERDEFSLCYQPQMDLETGKIHAMEALLRWNNENLGSVSPLKFISIAEETNLINPIGDWVLLNACKFLKELHNQGYTGLSVSVNVSIIQLMQQDFTEKVIKILSQAGVEPEYVELEITESVLIESYEGIKDKLMELREKGIRIALDDFGTGYSSLSYLTHIPINTLKIDKIFVDTILNDSDGTSLTSMIIMIGRKLGLSIVAEGVETENQLMYLKKHNCHMIQGYYFSKPLPMEEMVNLLNKDKELE